MNLLALDLGRKRVGVAVSHGILAEPLTTLKLDENNENQFLVGLEKIIKDQKVEKIIVGLPLGKNLEKTEQTRWVEKLSKKLSDQLLVPFEFVDEAYSTTMAHMSKDADVDAQAAKIILEQYLNEKR